MAQMTNRFAALLAKKEQDDNHRYSQKELAELAGVSPAVVSRWMNDKPEVGVSTLETMVKFCALFRCQLSDLVRVELPEREEQTA